MLKVIKKLKKYTWSKQLIVMPIYYLAQNVVPKVCVFINSTDSLTARDITKVLEDDFGKDYGISFDVYDKHYADFYIHLDGSKGFQPKGFTF